MGFSQWNASSAPQSLLQSLPKEAIGVGAFSWSSLSLLYQFTYPSGPVARKFDLCLPSSSRARGVILFGDSPYYLLHLTNFDAAGVLSYTPLHGDLIARIYYHARLTSIVPYTTLTSDIYSAILKNFEKAARGIAQAKKVAAFGLCFNTTTIRSRGHGLRIPQINLMLGNGVQWTIHGSNSIKQVDNDVGCLAFVDGGKMAKQAVVIGTYQIKNNFLLFDLDQSRLGFSTSLLPYGTSCGGFYFTVGSYF
ncbi:hypothetical protein ACJRO7_010295 [Eucalyptus globulus]|uniref:Peptidase A1 domain-containing protein n=1 Tax=Eucalyptus globulus TaxID=34317 RepID=A0ABD3LBL9_EUCGL